jgi:hypothetical protein
MRKSILLVISPLLLVLLFPGCTTHHRVRVDALSTGEVRGFGSESSYVLASGHEGVKESDLLFKNVARHLNPVLEGRGYRLADDAESADLQIVVDAYMSEPLVETERYSEPVYVYSGGYYQSYRVPVVNDKGKVVRYHYASYWEPSRMHHGGWVDQNRQITVYDKILRLSARPFLESGKLGDEEWTIIVALRDSSTDYRAALPILLMAADPYIGEQTDTQEVVVIRADAPELESYKVQ